jgi:hypothetical protein
MFQTRYKELLMLCFVKDIQPDQGDGEKSIKALRYDNNYLISLCFLSITVQSFMGSLIDNILLKISVSEWL